MNRPGFLAPLALGALLAGCAGQDNTFTPLPYPSGGDDTPTDDTGTTTPAGFGVDAVTDLELQARIATADGGACEVHPDGTTDGYERADCILDVPELDLWGYGLHLDVHAAEAACPFVEYDFYMYEAWTTGAGPTEVSYTIAEDGSITDEVNSVDGVPTCSYDHREVGEDTPNCCTGTYTLTVTDEREDPAEVRTSTEEWGGHAAECYGGAAYLYPQAVFDEDGWPMAILTYTAEAEFEDRLDWPVLSTDFSTNVPYASYYDPDDHAGNAPAGDLGDHSVPDYEFYCLDHAYEILGEVHVHVREWNEQDEWEARGNPDTTGFETGSGAPINDLGDWADVTPGDDTYIEDAE